MCPADQPVSSPSGKKESPRRKRLLNILIVVLSVLVGYLFYSFIDRAFIHPPVEPVRAGSDGTDVIQIDVLNGCGDAGMASRCTAFLRARGFDVVEIKNYKTFDLEKTFVIDRAGDRENAERVAHALGVREGNVVQQINQDYYVDVSVVIGKDYRTLKAFE
jgi:hypothetical protein